MVVKWGERGSAAYCRFHSTGYLPDINTHTHPHPSVTGGVRVCVFGGGGGCSCPAESWEEAERRSARQIQRQNMQTEVA